MKAIRILHLEDDPSDAELIQAELESAGIDLELTHVETAKQFEEGVKSKKYELILADYRLPDYDGLSAFHLSRSYCPETPFIFVSGTMGEDAAIHALTEGATDYVLKNKLSRLVPAVHRALQEAETRRERKLAEEALRASEERFRRYFELGLIGMAITSPKGRFIEVNDRICEILGYERTELMQLSWDTLTHPDELAADATYFKHLLSGEIHGYSIEKRCLRKDGAAIYTSISVNCVRRNDDTVDYVLALMEDITERKQAEEKLAVSEAKLRAVFAAMQDVVLIVDKHGIYREVAPTNPSLLALPPEELLGKSLQDVFPMEQANEFLKVVQNVVEERKIHQIEYPLQIGGKNFWFAATLTPMGNDATVLVAHDITERKQMEEALIKSEREYRHLFNSANDAVLIFEPDQQMILAANEAACALYGYDRYELIGLSLKSLTKDVHAGENNLKDLLITGACNNLETIHFNKSGEEINLLVNASLIEYEGRQAVLSLNRDIRARKQAEQKIQQQLERLTALREIDQVIASSFDMWLSLNTLLTQTCKLLDVDAADVMLVNPALSVLEYAAGTGFRTSTVQVASVRWGEGYAGRVASERQILQMPTLADIPDPLFRTGYLKDEGFTSYYGAPLVAKGKVLGVLEVFNRTVVERNGDWLDYFIILAGQAAIAIDNAQLFGQLQASNMELSLAYEDTIEGWSRALDLRDKETEGHTQRVTEMTMKLARHLGFINEQLAQIRRGALLHDIGKMGVPDNILLKADQLTAGEWVIMKQHTQFAYEMLRPISYLKNALSIPYCHHEKWDGTGYPRGLSGTDIPHEARLFAVVDVWDALTSDRPYRPKWSQQKALDYIRQQSGTHFDPRMVEVFLKEVAG